MTTAQLDHLRAIEAHLDQLLAIAAKRTPGEWYAEIYPSIKEAHDDGGFDWAGKRTFPSAVGSVWRGSERSNSGLPGSIEVGAGDATFISACANNAEAGWRSTKATIEPLIEREAAGCPFSKRLLEAILAEWPLETLKP